MSIVRWLLVVVSFAVCLPVHAQTDWSGKTVILKRPGLKIGYTDEKTGNQVYVANLTKLSYVVLRDANGFLRIQHGGETGWLAKTEVLLPEEAVPYFAEKVKLAKDDDPMPFAYLGWAHLEQKNLEPALHAYDTAIKRDSKLPWLYNNRGLIHRALKKYPEASADFSEALKRDPNFTLAYENRAATYELQGKLIMALDDWNQALKIEPANGPYLLRRAQNYASQRDFVKAIADLTTQLKDDPKNADVLELRGQFNVDAGNVDAAINDYSEVLRINPNNVTVFLGRSQVYTDTKQFAKAIADCEGALRVVPTFVDARNRLGWNRFLTGDFQSARNDFERALEMKAKYAPTNYYLAWLFATCPDEKFRDGKKALEYAKTAVELTGGKEAAMLEAHAAALAETGDFDEAIKLQERVVREIAAAEQAESRSRLETYRKKQPYRQTIAK